ncbi:MAG: hypothetical protein AAFP88_01470, partial [Bacteroidota bacterium]
MIRHLISYTRLSFLLYLLAALSTGCNTDQHELGFCSKSKTQKQNLLDTLNSRLADHGGSDQAHRDYDPYDRDIFRGEMELIITGEKSARKAIYEYGSQKCSMLTVAAHYDLSGKLVKYLLKKKVHKRMEEAQITRCFEAAIGNDPEEDIKREILELLVKAFKKSSRSYFQSEDNLERLRSMGDYSSRVILIEILN